MTEMRNFTVVVNGEEQYSIWPVDRVLPLGWEEIGVRGSKEACLEHIERIWVDMRPASARGRAASRSTVATTAGGGELE